MELLPVFVRDVQPLSSAVSQDNSNTRVNQCKTRNDVVQRRNGVEMQEVS